MVRAFFYYLKDKGVGFELTKKLNGKLLIHKFDDTIPTFNEFLFRLCEKPRFMFLWNGCNIDTGPNKSHKLPPNFQRWLEELWGFEDYYEGRFGYLQYCEADDEGIVT